MIDVKLVLLHSNTPDYLTVLKNKGLPLRQDFREYLTLKMDLTARGSNVPKQ